MHERRFPVMGTTAHVLVVDGTPADLDRAQHRLEDLERRWSRFRPDSELSQVNARPGVPVIVSAETYQLLGQAVAAWRLTDGLFDPTVGATMVAAGYGDSFDLVGTAHASGPPAHVRPPGPAGVVFHPYLGAVELTADVMIDLGGIAKGAAADLVAAELLESGVAGCCVNVGGDLRVMGRPPRPQGWQVRLECPGGGPAIPIGLVDGAVCTTTKVIRRWPGRNGWEHHLRNADSGAPLETGLASVSIIAARGVQAEVLTKAIFAAGAEAGTAIAAANGVTGALVDDDGLVSSLPGLAPFTAAAMTAAVALPGSSQERAEVATPSDREAA